MSPDFLAGFLLGVALSVFIWAVIASFQIVKQELETTDKDEPS